MLIAKTKSAKEKWLRSEGARMFKLRLMNLVTNRPLCEDNKLWQPLKTIEDRPS